MDGTLSSITDALGQLASGKLGHALIGLLILVVGLIVVSLISSLFKRLLKRVGFLDRTNLAAPLASLVKALLTIFVLIAVLQHFGLTGVLAPLKNMLNKFLAAIPNIIGAGVIGYAGWVIAKIVAELVGIALHKVDQKLADNMGNSGMKLSKIGSAFMFAAILIPIAVSALGVLNIPSITGPASDMLNKLMAAIPNIIGAGIILAVTYFIAKFVVSMLSNILDGMGIDALPQRLGITGVFTGTFTPTKLVGNVIMFFAMLTAITAAVNTLGIDIVSNIFAKVLEFGGGILVGGVILLLGYFLSTLAYNKLQQYGNSGIANIARIAILGLVLAMGLRAMGLADNIVNMAFGFTLGAVAIAAALAFGLGGRDAAKRIANGWADKISNS
ncbi:MAG: mechanosensitive ion channel [Thiothrix sp.]|uniref:mechanosensitive ion channel n=1 Tax=Thiothrix sp. TaxID=1032 RepID=UPI0026356AF6|nr:mechanosensitive ion channel [Thiothrix sp.]MDD5392247.1 mechanosensitive ion channel [Thiothrix sp.]